MCVFPSLPVCGSQFVRYVADTPRGVDLQLSVSRNTTKGLTLAGRVIVSAITEGVSMTTMPVTGDTEVAAELVVISGLLPVVLSMGEAWNSKGWLRLTDLASSHSKLREGVRPIFDIVRWKVGEVGFDDPTFLPPLSPASVGLFLLQRSR
jgi:hypothetical protein